MEACGKIHGFTASLEDADRKTCRSREDYAHVLWF
jgi:hypothetical protein